MGETTRPTVPRLNGWKEIASHFGRAVRTVQRWERELGLPVHRLATGKGETVYALVDELDAWLAANERAAAAPDEAAAVAGLLERPFDSAVSDRELRPVSEWDGSGFVPPPAPVPPTERR